MNPVLAIDPEFEAKCPPLTEDEFQQLEENILEEGLVLMPIIIWNNIIIDGHNRYKIAMANPGIEFRTHEKVFDSRYEALSWICKHQLGRRNLTPQQKKYLVGERYNAEKKANGASDGFRGNQYDKVVHGQNDHVPKIESTREKIARETQTSESYVKRADQYARGVNAAEEVLPGIREEILSGKIKPKESEVSAIARISPTERREKAEKLRIPREKPPTKHRRQDYQEIEEAYEELKKQDKKVTENDALDSIRAAVQSMLRVCDNFIEYFPRLISEETYKGRLVEIMQEPKSYIMKLEGESE